jgi:hypothetical protein
MMYDVCHGKRREWAGADNESNRQERAALMTMTAPSLVATALPTA